MSRKKWCLGRRDVICTTQDCPYMHECIQLVYRQRLDELEEMGRRLPALELPKVKKMVRRRAREERRRD